MRDSGETWFWLFAVTLGPQILGHTVLNWVLRYVATSIISGTILAEPVVSAFLAWLVLSEKPGLATLQGGRLSLWASSCSSTAIVLSPTRWSL